MESFASVSYTHLDVYKRQGNCNSHFEYNFLDVPSTMDFYSTDINQNVAPLPGEGTVARTASKAHYSLWYNNALKLTNILLKSLRCKLQTNRYEEDRGFDVYYVIIKSIALLMTAKESLILSQIPPSLPVSYTHLNPR